MAEATLPVIKEIDWIRAAYGIVLSPKHIASELNEASDALTRSHQMEAADLLEILRRWASSHPNFAYNKPHRPRLVLALPAFPTTPLPYFYY